MAGSLVVMRAGSLELVASSSELNASGDQILFANKQGHFSEQIHHQAGGSPVGDPPLVLSGERNHHKVENDSHR